MKRLLLITYYFPPCGGAGVQRWLKLIKYLLNEDWETTVITTNEGDYPVLDPSLCKKIPPNMKVIRTKTPSLTKVLKLISPNSSVIPYGSLEQKEDDFLLKKTGIWLRNNVLITDSRAIWNKHAINTAKKEIRKKRYDLVVTTGPPQSTHLVGLKLKEMFPVLWSADFRDPWTKIFYLQNIKATRISAAINQNREERVVANADLTTVISQNIADSLPVGNKHVLYNGYDPEDYLNTEYKRSSFFRIKYIGRLTQGQDIIKPLIWLNEFSKSKQIETIEVSLVGSFSSFSELERRFYNLHVRIIDYKSHYKAINEMVNADVLLLLINECSDNKGILTSKLFEYIGSRTYTVGIGPVDGEAAELLKKYNAGTMISYDNYEGFINTIESLYRKWDNQTLKKNRSKTSALSTPEQAKELATLYNNIIIKK